MQYEVLFINNLIFLLASGVETKGMTYCHRYFSLVVFKSGNCTFLKSGTRFPFDK